MKTNTITEPKLNHAQRTAELLQRLEKPRGAWQKGVQAYALEMLEEYEPEQLDEKGLLNGASNWKEYSYGGNAKIYDADIAAALCNASFLWKKRGGSLQPSLHETWLDVQARALFQASNLILKYAPLTA
tara:strand:+ start:1371 stop:1757 length:387 start_codon:yes stop_codon:yes gene_type:complete